MAGVKNSAVTPLPPAPRTGVSGRYDFSWETLRSFLEGVSPIDLQQLALRDRDEARDFLLRYGYDLEDEQERAEVQQVHIEAAAFLVQVLCPAPRPVDTAVELPPELLETDDPSQLLVWASADPDEEPLQPWACALLRVMHTITHANHAVRSPFYPEIKRQILDRYRRHLHYDTDNRLHLGRGALAVPLEGVFFREEKSRDRLILKLLHKPDNVAQSVYDRIGVKLVTSTRVDALLALKYIRKRNLAIFAHITPGRSRNTLVNLAQFRRTYEKVTRTDQDEDVTDEQFLQSSERDRDSLETGLAPANPHSSPDFCSIQFTCRQLIKVKNPAYNVAKKLYGYLAEHHISPELESMLSQLEGHLQERQLRFFFPYEVQIIDLENHLRTEVGPSSHADYQLRQLRTARRRVLGRILRRD